MRALGRAVVAPLVAVLLLAGTPVATADPVPPTPPPNPTDGQLSASRDAVGARAAEVGRLSTQLADLDQQTDDLQAALATRREDAEAALVDLAAAQDAAAAAARKADLARAETDAATAAIDAARARMDDLLAHTYEQGPDLGPLGLLSTATGPDDLIDRAQYGNLIAEQQRSVQDSLEKARIGKANADAAARAALDEARRRQAAAATAKTAADGALAAADAAARAQARQLAAIAAQRAQVQAQLDAAVSADAGLRAQRDRFRQWQADQAAAQARAQQAERAAAAQRVAAAGAAPGRGGPGAIQRVIDRAMSQLGVQYVWGGGNGRGPTTGIPDGLGSPLDRIGFDCSGLMLYAFGGAGISLPRVSRNQFNAGTKVPISDIRPGDMLFWADPGEPIHHVAMYIGNGNMIEAPYTGASVRVTKVRTKGLLPEATRML
ncbi:NlpC/P60 family protein [Pseudonocardia sp. CA-107938]|uniref:C40 family peptidase n=1 Tax=Pseudonocardia sp. CA-107938 TaxID=3240021 RepID=UPI003D92B1AC